MKKKLLFVFEAITQSLPAAGMISENNKRNYFKIKFSVAIEVTQARYDNKSNLFC